MIKTFMIEKLNFDLLTVLVAVAESSNFYEAATRLKITQPSVSLKMKELEAALPVPVFHLEGKRKVLTHYGRAVYQLAKSQLDNLENDFQTLNRHYALSKDLTLKIAGRAEVIDFLIPKINFDGKIHTQTTTSTEAVKKLLAHEIDLAISHILPDSNEVIAKEIMRSSANFIIHRKFLKRRKLNLDLLSDKDFLGQTPSIFYYKEGHILKDWIKHVGLELETLNDKYVCDDWKIVQNFVAQGLGYAFVPEYVANTSSDVMVYHMNTSVIPKYTFYALYAKSLRKIPAFATALKF
jgi:DNA-binding transcriptional LysR family regulator